MLINLLLLVLAVLAYAFVIRPRLKARLPDLYARLESRELSLWQKISARLRGFWIELTGALGLVMTSLPDLVPGLMGIDFGTFTSADIAKKIVQGLSLAALFIKVFARKDVA